LYFNPQSNNSYPYASPAGDSSFILFAERNTDGHLDDGGTNPISACATSVLECREIYRLQGGLTFDNTVVPGQAIVGCPNSTTPCDTPINLSAVPINIIFNRPNPEANFYAQNGAASPTPLTCGAGLPCVYVRIAIKSARLNTSRYVYVWNTGHIYASSS
jgi:hypothetical protein